MVDEPFESKGDEEKIQGDDDWENRILCSDESCIGIIGPDGRCKECGKPYRGSSAPEMQTAQPESSAGNDADRSEKPAEQAEAEQAEEDDWENRILCSDESCIGIIGPDGRCKECGKPYQG
jgi:hypothetical protein